MNKNKVMIGTLLVASFSLVSCGMDVDKNQLNTDKDSINNTITQMESQNNLQNKIKKAAGEGIDKNDKEVEVKKDGELYVLIDERLDKDKLDGFIKNVKGDPLFKSLNIIVKKYKEDDTKKMMEKYKVKYLPIMIFSKEIENPQIKQGLVKIDDMYILNIGGDFDPIKGEIVQPQVGGTGSVQNGVQTPQIDQNQLKEIQEKLKEAAIKKREEGSKETLTQEEINKLIDEIQKK